MCSEETNHLDERVHGFNGWWGLVLSVLMIVGVTLMLFMPPAQVTLFHNQGLILPTDLDEYNETLSTPSVEVYLNSYHNNVLKAISMFDGNICPARGYIADTGIDNGQYYVDLIPSAISAESGRFVRCYFEDAAVFAPLNSISAGRELRIVGTCSVTHDKGVQFLQCSKLDLMD